MTNETEIIREYLKKKWDSTEPGLRWAYVLSIVGVLLSVISHPSYTHTMYRWMNFFVIPAALCAWIVGNLSFRLIWLGFITHFILLDIAIIYDACLRFGGPPIGPLFFYISLVLVIFALVMGFRSINLKKASYLFFEKAPMRLFAVFYLLTILSYPTDILLRGYLPYTYRYIDAYTTTFSYINPFFMIFIYILLTVSIERRYYLGVVLTPVLSIAIVVPWSVFNAYRLNSEFLKQFYKEVTIYLVPLSRKIVITKAIVSFIFPILLIAIVLYFLKCIWNSVPPERSARKGV